MRRNTSHRLLILAALRDGFEITPWNAVEYWNCWRLGARVYELRRMGIPIVDLNKGTKTRFARYFLKPEFRNLAPDFSRLSPSKPRKSSDKVLPRDSDTGRFKPLNNPLTKEVAARARMLYREGAVLRQVYQEFPDTSQWDIYKDLKQQGLLRHRGQRKDSERQLAFSELGDR
ncbi:hypothetical protein ES703_80916 [subsurface metagenome]